MHGFEQRLDILISNRHSEPETEVSTCLTVLLGEVSIRGSSSVPCPDGYGPSPGSHVGKGSLFDAHCRWHGWLVYNSSEVCWTALLEGHTWSIVRYSCVMWEAKYLDRYIVINHEKLDGDFYELSKLFWMFFFKHLNCFTEMKPPYQYSSGPRGYMPVPQQPPPSYGYSPAPPVLSQQSSSVRFCHRTMDTYIGI